MGTSWPQDYPGDPVPSQPPLRWGCQDVCRVGGYSEAWSSVPSLVTPSTTTPILAPLWVTPQEAGLFLFLKKFWTGGQESCILAPFLL